jgi:hypothetical protein
LLAFLDTEFTDLVIRPRLLSVGLVTDAGVGRDFYAEVTDADRIRATGWYGLGAVLPQFGKISLAACSYAELGSRLSSFLDEMSAELQSGEYIELAYGYPLDWELVDLAVRDSGSSRWASTRRSIRPVNVYQLTGFGAGKLAAEAYFAAQSSAPYARHHALCDARALRLAYLAATRESTTPSPTSRLPVGQHCQCATT